MDFNKQVEQMAALMRYVQGDLVSKKAFGEFLQALTGVWKGLKQANDKQFRDHYAQVGEALRAIKSELLMGLREQKMELLTKSDVDNRKNREQLQSAVNRLTDEIQRVERSIPNETDLDPLERRIDQVEAKIPEVKTLAEVWDKFDELEEKIQEVRGVKEKAPLVQFGAHPNYKAMFVDIDISDQLNGSDATFNIHAIYNVLSVSLSSYPYALRKGVEYTWTPTSITFTSMIDPATQLASGQTCVLTVVSG